MYFNQHAPLKEAIMQKVKSYGMFAGVHVTSDYVHVHIYEDDKPGIIWADFHDNSKKIELNVISTAEHVFEDVDNMIAVWNVAKLWRTRGFNFANEQVCDSRSAFINAFLHVDDYDLFFQFNVDCVWSYNDDNLCKLLPDHDYKMTYEELELLLPKLLVVTS